MDVPGLILPLRQGEGGILSDETIWDRPHCKWVKHFRSFSEPSLSALDLTFCLRSGGKLSTMGDLNCQSDVFPWGPQGLRAVRKTRLLGFIFTHISDSNKNRSHLMTLLSLDLFIVLYLGFYFQSCPCLWLSTTNDLTPFKVPKETAAPHRNLECVE